MNNVEFLWGENLSDTTPAINQGQILFDKTTSTLHIDTEDGRQKVLDDTKLNLTGGTLVGPLYLGESMKDEPPYTKEASYLVFQAIGPQIRTTINIDEDGTFIIRDAQNNSGNGGSLVLTPSTASIVGDTILFNSITGNMLAYLNNSGIQLTSQDMKITGVATTQIIDNSDVTNKEYVDNRTSWIEW